MSTDRRSGAERRERSRFHLTPRELEVLALVLRGAGNKEIASTLGVTEQAIKEHVSTLLDKFDVPNRAALAEAGSRLEFTGEHNVDRSWMRELFLSAQPQICVLRGPDLRYEAVNEAFTAAVGGRQTIGRTMREAFPELAGQGVFEKVEQVYAAGVPLTEHEVERRWDRGNGVEVRLVDIVMQPLHDAAGAVNGVVSFAFDVTELVEQRKRSELLREEYAAVLDQVPSGVVVLDENSRVVKINEAGRRIARGRPVTGDDFPIARALKGEDVPTQEFTFTAGDPAVRIKLRTSVRTLRDPDGRIRGVIAVFTELA